MTKLEGVKVALTTKIKISVSKAKVFTYLIRSLVHREGRSLRLVVYDNRTCEKLDISGVQVVVFGTLISFPDFPAYFNYALRLELGE
jgi:hypothetical protein